MLFDFYMRTHHNSCKSVQSLFTPVLPSPSLIPVLLLTPPLKLRHLSWRTTPAVHSVHLPCLSKRSIYSITLISKGDLAYTRISLQTCINGLTMAVGQLYCALNCFVQCTIGFLENLDYARLPWTRTLSQSVEIVRIFITVAFFYFPTFSYAPTIAIISETLGQLAPQKFMRLFHPEGRSC